MSWFLKENGSFFDYCSRLVLPWSWITDNKPSASWANLMHDPPFGLRPGTPVRLGDIGCKTQHPVVFAANDERLLQMLLNPLNVKGAVHAVEEGEFLEVKPDPAGAMRFKFTAVFDFAEWLVQQGVTGKILAQRSPSPNKTLTCELFRGR